MDIKQQNALKPLKIVATADHIGSLTQASALGAISELIWNGFDASSHKIDILYNFNKMDGLETIVVQDYGNGIPIEDAELYFSSIGDSWKKAKKKNYHHPLHGQNGKGRFKAFCLGADVEWQTSYLNKDTYEAYSIHGNHNQIDEFKTSSITHSKNGIQGTKVIISNLLPKANDLQKNKTLDELTKKFAVFLTEYPHLSLNFNGAKVDPKSVQNQTKDYDLTDLVEGITDHPIKLTIIEWNIETDRIISLCTEKGISLAEYEPKSRIKAKGFNFTAYIKSKYFQELENNGLLSLAELEPSVNKITDVAVAIIQEHFR